MTPQEKLFIQIAIRKNYINQAMVEKALLLKNRYLQQGYSVSLPQILLQSKSLSSEQMQDIEVEYKFKASTVPPLKSPNNRLSNSNQVSNAKNPNIISRELSAIESSEVSSDAISNKPPISVIGSDEVLPNVISNKPPMSTIGSDEVLPNVVSSRPPMRAIGSNETGISRETSPEIVVPDQTKQFSSGDKMFNHYTIGKELGRGGMGVVYKAYDTKLKRTVALKLLLAKQVSEVQKERFRREAEAMAQLEHPNIIKIYEVGESPQMFLTMEYICGQTFLDHIIQNTMDLKKRLEIMRDTASAIHFIHKKGYIHRDIKPANIMINEKKEPKVMDFGLVKFNDSSLSKTSDVLGTPVFMPPEQLGSGEVDRRSDVYSLGASLYRVLAGRPPFQGDTAFNIMYQVTTKEPIPLRELNPDIPPQLEAICLKCLEKKMHYRYATAKELADDIDNYLHNKPIVARPPTRIERAQKWVRNNKLPSVIGLIIFTLLVMTYFLKLEAEENFQRAEREWERAEKGWSKAEKEKNRADERAIYAGQQKAIAENSYYDFAINLCNEYLQKGNVRNIKEILTTMEKKIKSEELNKLKSWEWNWLKGATSNWNHKILATESGKSFSTFGKGNYNNYLAICGGAKDNSNLALIDMDTRKIYKLNAVHKTKFCDFSNNGEYLLSGGEDNLLRLWSVKTKSLLRSFKDGYDAKTKFPISHTQEINCCLFSENNRYIISGSKDHYIKIWNPKTGKKIQEFKMPQRVKFCSFFDNDRKIISVSEYGVVMIFDVKTKKRLITESLAITKVTNGHIGRIGANKVLTVCGEKKLGIWKLNDFANKNPQPIFSLSAQREFSSAKVLKEQLLVADNTIMQVWDVRAKKLVKSLFNNKNITAFAMRGKNIVTLDKGGVTKLWNLNHQRPVKLKCSDPNKYISFARFVNRDTQVLFGEYSKLFEFNIPKNYIKTPQEITRNRLKDKLRIGQLSDGDICGKYRVATGEVSSLTIYNRFDNELVYEPQKTRTKNAPKCRFSPTNPNEMTAIGKNIVFIWKIKEKQLIFNKKISSLLKEKVGNPDGRHIAYRADGKQIAIASESYEILFINPEKRALDYSLYIEEARPGKPRLGKPRISHCTYSLDGKKLAVCSEKKTVMVYFFNETTQRFEKDNRIVFRGHHQEVLCSSFSPDGKRLISGGNDKQLLLWNVNDNTNSINSENNLPLLTFDIHEKAIINCQFSTDGKRILSADEDAIYIWDTTDH